MAGSIDAQIGERVRRFREAAELDVVEVAKACGLTMEEYEASEAGERPFGAAELVQMRFKFGVSFEDLFHNLRL